MTEQEWQHALELFLEMSDQKKQIIIRIRDESYFLFGVLEHKFYVVKLEILDILESRSKLQKVLDDNESEKLVFYIGHEDEENSKLYEALKKKENWHLNQEYYDALDMIVRHVP